MVTTICGHYTQRSGGGKLPVTARESLLAKPLGGAIRDRATKIAGTIFEPPSAGPKGEGH